MRQLCDPDGRCVENEYDLEAQSMIRFTGLPRPTVYGYDHRGNIRSVRNGLDEVTLYDHRGPRDVLVSRTDPDGAVTRFEYRFRSRDVMARIDPHLPGEDPEDFTTRFGYRLWDVNFLGEARRAELNEIRLPTGGTIHYEVDDDGNRLEERDDADNVLITRAYNPDGTIDTYTDRFGTHGYVYGPEGLPSQVTEPDGTVTLFAYDPLGNVARVKRDGVEQRFVHDALGRRLFADYGNGATVTYEYDGGDEWTAIEGPTFGRVERVLSAAGNVLSWTMPNGDTGAQTFDAANQLTTSTDALGNVTTYEYDLAGRLERVVDPVRGTTTYTRDEMGRPLTITDPTGEVRSFTYDIRGAVATSTDERMNTTTSVSAPTGTTTTDLLTHTTTSALTTYGLPGTTTYPGGANTSVDFVGRTAVDESTSFPNTQTDEQGRVRAFGYDSGSVLNSATDLAGNAWQYTHTEALGGDIRFDVFSGEVSVGVDGARAPVSMYSSRDEERDGHRPEALDVWVDRLQSVTSPEGETTTWTYGAGGRAVLVSYPFGGVMTRTLGADLRVRTETRPFGTTLTFTRDASGRVLSRTGTDGSSRAFTYGPNNRIDTITDATGTTAYTYDAAGRLDGLDYPTGARFEQDWDSGDRVERAGVRTPSAEAFDTTYTYDAAGNLETLTDPFGRTTTYTYDAANQLETITRPNGVVTTYTYNPRGRVLSVVHEDAASNVLASVTYVRSASGEPTRVTREDGTYVIVTYDAALRVEREQYYDAADVLEEEIAYTYDQDGNRTSRTTSAGTETYVYASGSRLERVEIGGTPVAELTYDTGARVTRIQRGAQDLEITYDADDHVIVAEDAATNIRREYDFDAEDRRVARRRLVAGALAASLSLVTAPGLASNLESPHAEVDAATGVAQTGYIYEGEHAHAAYDSATGDERYYLRDAMGSVIAIVNADASDSARIHYDGFGNERRTDGSLAALPEEGAPRFQGMWREPDGLYYVRARNYEPETGRFLSRDPAAGARIAPVTFLPYLSEAGNPFRYRDATGRVFTIGGLSQSVRVRISLTLTAVSAGGQRFSTGSATGWARRHLVPA